MQDGGGIEEKENRSRSVMFWWEYGRHEKWRCALCAARAARAFRHSVVTRGLGGVRCPVAIAA